MCILHGLTSVLLVSEGLAHGNQPRHEGIFASEVGKEVVDVPAWVRDNTRNQVAHRLLELVDLLVDVDRVRAREECHWGVNVAWVTPNRVLFDHEAHDRASFNHILGDRADQFFARSACCVVNHVRNKISPVNLESKISYYAIFLLDLNPQIISEI